MSNNQKNPANNHVGSESSFATGSPTSGGGVRRMEHNDTPTKKNGQSVELKSRTESSMAFIRDVNRQLTDENIALRKCLNLVLERCDLNTANILVAAMTAQDTKLRNFLTGNIPPLSC